MVPTGIVTDRTCEMAADGPPSQRWLNRLCGKPAVGHVVDGQRSTLVCDACIKMFEVENEHIHDLNRSNLGLKTSFPKYQVNRW